MPCQYEHKACGLRLGGLATRRRCYLCRHTDWFLPQMLAFQEFRRVGGQSEGFGAPCPRYGIRVDEKFCTECLGNGYLRQLLFSRYVLGRKRQLVCAQRGEETGTVDRQCCGGKVRSFRSFRCARTAQDIVPELDCCTCSSFSHAELAQVLDRDRLEEEPCPHGHEDR